MSAVVKTRRRKSFTVSTLILWVVLGFAAVFFLFSYGQELLLAHSLNDKSAAQRIENAKEQDEITRLQAQLQYYQSDKYIEQRAREDLNLRRPDEQVLIPVWSTPGATGQSTGPGGIAGGHDPAQPPASTPTQAKPNWQKWLDLFGP